MDLITLRTTLLITLSILLVVVLVLRLKRSLKDVPVASHAELLDLEVMYHPARLRVRVQMPKPEVLHTALLSTEHAAMHHWNMEAREGGMHVIERALPALADGSYCFELRTSTQRTVRQFRLQQV